MTDNGQDATPKPEPSGEAQAVPVDMRAALERDLKADFTAKLKSVGKLPHAAVDSLAALLESSNLTPSDVLLALAKEDTVEKVVPGE